MWNLKCERAKNQKRWRTEHFSFHCKWAFIKIVCVLNWLYWIYIQIHINKFKKRVILFTRVPLDFPVTSLVRLSRAKNALRYKCHHLGLKKCLGRPVIPIESRRGSCLSWFSDSRDGNPAQVHHTTPRCARKTREIFNSSELWHFLSAFQYFQRRQGWAHSTQTK